MTDFSKIRPVGTKILFKFVEDITSGTFDTTSKAGLVVVEDEEKKIKEDRWGEVIALGSEIEEDTLTVGEFILIEALGWTTAMTVDDAHDAEKFWFTELDKVLCVAYDKPDTRI